MNEERKMILEMVKEGTVTVEEGEKLLATLSSEEEKSGTLQPHSNRRLEPKRLLITVTENGRPKVNMKIPFSLLRIGLKLGKSFSSIGQQYTKDPAGAQALEALKSVDIDELLDSLSEGDITLPYVMMDVDDVEKGEHVEVVLE